MRGMMLAVVAVGGWAGVAAGQITPVFPFSGPYTEGLEGAPYGGQHCVAGRVFNGTADLCSFLPNGGNNNVALVAQTVMNGSCSISARSGAHFFYAFGGDAEILFDAPVGRFGGYFGTASGVIVVLGGTARFFDGAGGLIGSENWTVGACGGWNWHGWQSTAPIKRVQITGNGDPAGGSVALDDLEYWPACYANCDGSTAAPALNVNDFTCFLNRFAQGDPYANCDGSTTAPALNVNDFTCFLNLFAAGCA